MRIMIKIIIKLFIIINISCIMPFMLLFFPSSILNVLKLQHIIQNFCISAYISSFIVIAILIFTERHTGVSLIIVFIFLILVLQLIIYSFFAWGSFLDKFLFNGILQGDYEKMIQFISDLFDHTSTIELTFNSSELSYVNALKYDIKNWFPSIRESFMLQGLILLNIIGSMSLIVKDVKEKQSPINNMEE